MAYSRKTLVDVIVLLALAVLGVLGYKLAPLLTPKTDLTLPLAACDPGRESCRIDLPGGGAIEFTIDPKPVPSLRPLQLRVRADADTVRGVAVDFVGVDMKMGYNRPTLTRSGAQQFEGSTSLPVCVTGAMPWEATVLLDTDSGTIAIPFRFQAVEA